MDAQGFDRLAVAFAARSRRRLLRGLAGAAGVLLAGHRPGAPDASARQGGTPAPVADGSGLQPGTALERYVSPTWGFSLSWDAAIWTPDPSQMAAGVEQERLGISDYDQVVLNGAGGTLRVNAYRGNEGDPGQCLDYQEGLVKETPGVTDFAPERTRDKQPLGGTTEEGAVWDIYTYARDGGRSLDVYFECRTLQPGEAVLFASFTAPRAATFNAALSQALAVIDTLELPGAGEEIVIVDPHAETPADAPSTDSGGAAGGIPIDRGLPLGGRCTEASQCNQDNGAVVCRPLEARATGDSICCRTHDQACTRHADCCSGSRCDAGKCACLPRGAACENSKECCTSYCRNKTCQVQPTQVPCIPEYGWCGDGGQCCDGLCDVTSNLCLSLMF